MKRTEQNKAKSLSWSDERARYGVISRALHWLTAILIIFSFGLAWTWVLPGRGPLQNAMVDAHCTVGLLVLFLTAIRILRRFAGRPATLDDFPLWIRLLARSVQFLLLCLLVVLPILGWAYTNAGGFDVSSFGLTLPRLTVKDTYLAELTAEWHELFAYTLLALLSLHIAGAIAHWLGLAKKRN